MADVKVSGLPTDSSLDGNHYVPVNDPTGPTTKRTLLSTLASFFFNQTNIPAGSGSPVTRADELGSDHVNSGLVITADNAGVNRNASMTSGIVYINGRRISISAVSARTYTASKDTYVDILDNADGTGTVVYTEVANNAASPSLAANSIRIGTVVTGATTIAASTSIGQGGLANTVPTISSQILKGFDSLGNTIYPKGPANPKYMQNPCMFKIYRAAAQTPNGVPIVFDTKVFDVGNNCNTSNGRFVAPISGYYQIHSKVTYAVTAAPQDPQITLRKNGATNITVFHYVQMYNGASAADVIVSDIVPLVAGDYLEIVGVNLAITTGSSSCHFSGYLVSAS